MAGWGSVPQAYISVSNVNFYIGAVSIDISYKIPKGTVLAHRGFKSKVFPESLTDIGVWLGYLHLKVAAGFQISTSKIGSSGFYENPV